MATNIINQKVNDFLETYDFKKDKRGEAYDFEKFCNYLVLLDEIEIIDADDDVKELVESGNVENAEAIDGLFILIDEQIQTNLEQVKKFFISNANKRYTLKLLITQCKYKEQITNESLSNFVRISKGLRDCDKNILNELSNNAKNSNNSYLQDKISILSFLSEKLGRAKIECSIYFSSLNQIKDDQKKILQEDYWKSYNFSKEELIKKYDQSFDDFTVNINLDFNKLSIIKSSNYFGLIPYEEFKKIVFTKDEQSIRKNIFDQNIRDYVGKNEVNKKIEETIEKDIENFYLYNNGITVICKKITNNAKGLDLKGIKVVNGCQTTNSIFNKRDNQNIKDLLIPIKLLSTEDTELRDKITYATNTQNQIKDFTVLSLMPFVKELEKYYKNKHEPINFYFERLENQYKNDAIEKNKIVSIQLQAKIYLATFIGRPDSASGFGKIKPIKEIKAGSIFNEKHKVEKYYFVTYLYFQILIKIDSSQEKYIYLFLSIIFDFIQNKHKSKIDNNKINDLVNIINNMQEDFEDIFKHITKLIKNPKYRYIKYRIEEIKKKCNYKNLPDNLKKYASNC